MVTKPANGPLTLDPRLKAQLLAMPAGDVEALIRRVKERNAAKGGSWKRLPVWWWVAASALALWGLFFSANPILTPAGVMVLPILGSLLWLRGEPPILLFSCAMQWLQAMLAVFYADYYGSPVEDFWGVPFMEQATWLSLGGIVVMAVGMRLALLRHRAPPSAEMLAEVKRLSVPHLFLGWLAAFLVVLLITGVAFAVPGLTQLLLGVTNIKWVALYLLAFSVLASREGYGRLMIAFVLEFVVGLTGAFGNFKEIFFMVFLASLSQPTKLSTLNRLLVVTLVPLLIAASLIWTTVKMDYREILRSSRDAEGNRLSADERLNQLGNLVSAIDDESIAKGTEDMIARIAYTEFFARTIAYVPHVVPHENGALWLGAVLHVVQPRLFFPDKESVNDSRRAAKYTGLSISGAEEGEGTSIGIGYMGESYIDFGPTGMLLPVFLLGLFLGAVYRYFAQCHRSSLVGSAMATGVLFSTIQMFGNSNVKIVGSMVVACLTMFVVNKWVGSRAMEWLRVRRSFVPPMATARARSIPMR
jgi:hypothetical protein